jgi:5-methylphenazine-1-carboxylate 1-monooxygenase
MWHAAVDWPVFEGGDVMLIAADLVAKLTVYPIVEGRTAVTRPTNWVTTGKMATGELPPATA